MSQFYQLTEASKLGEPWESHGNNIQTWWCKVDDEELAVSIGKQVGNELRVGQQLYGDLMKAVSKKGNEFWKFKSSQVPDGVVRPPELVAPNTGLEARVKKLEDAVFNKTETKPETKSEEPDAIDLSDIPF